jgi:AcrR family transcriptional regulator
MVTAPGRRERKKQQTRQLIFDAASRLFAERGFDAVTVSEVAEAADVAEVTVFNYFPTKDDLFFSGLAFYEARLLGAVRGRAVGESPLSAFRGLLLDGSRLQSEEVAAVIGRAAAIIRDSPALQAREREIAARYTQQLADLLAEEAGAGPGNVEAAAVASALMGVHRALLAHVRARVLSGWHGPRLAADARSQVAQAMARLEEGIASYGLRRA